MKPEINIKVDVEDEKVNDDINNQQQPQSQPQQDQEVAMWLMQRQLFVQRQFIEMIMNDGQQQANLMCMDPLQRTAYIENEINLHQQSINESLQCIPNEIIQQEFMMMNETMQRNGEGGLDMNGMNGMNQNGMMMMNTSNMMMNGSNMMMNTSNLMMNTSDMVMQNTHNSQQQQQQRPFIQYQAPDLQPRDSGHANNMMNSPAMIRLANANQQNTMPAQLQALAAEQNNNNNVSFGIQNFDVNTYQLPPQPQLSPHIELGPIRTRQFDDDDDDDAYMEQK